jgi:hypothetical protein
VKRGLITWDKTEIPAAVFEQRVNRVRRVLAERDLPALAVYSELWRSNQARFFSNFMPYFNRALLIIPRELSPTLLCGLSPRVYGWIRSVTTIEDVRPAGNFAKPLFEIATERSWSRLGVLDLDQLPYDIHHAIRGGSLDPANVPSRRGAWTQGSTLAKEILDAKCRIASAASIITLSGVSNGSFEGRAPRISLRCFRMVTLFPRLRGPCSRRIIRSV